MSDAVAKNYANLETTSHTSGLSIIATVVCDHAAWLCEVKDLIALPLAYKVAEECVNYGIGNADRITNRSIDLERLRERAAYFGAQYAALMEQVLANMRVPSDRVCFDCYKRTTQIVAIP